MTPLPTRLTGLAMELAEGAPSGERHLMLLGYEGLYVLERWQYLRHFHPPLPKRKVYIEASIPFAHLREPGVAAKANENRSQTHAGPLTSSSS